MSDPAAHALAALAGVAWVVVTGRVVKWGTGSLDLFTVTGPATAVAARVWAPVFVALIALTSVVGIAAGVVWGALWVVSLGAIRAPWDRQPIYRDKHSTYTYS